MNAGILSCRRALGWFRFAVAERFVEPGLNEGFLLGNAGSRTKAAPYLPIIREVGYAGFGT